MPMYHNGNRELQALFGSTALADRLVERLRQAQAQGMSPFSALVETYLADAQLDNTECGCVVAALASEIPRQAEEVASAARRPCVQGAD